MPEGRRMKVGDFVYIGIKGQVVALDRSTGQQLWAARIKGGQFVNVVLDGDRILAAANGELVCLDAFTGTEIWRNELRGFGTGLMSIATANAPAGAVLNQQAQIQAQQAAAAAVATASIAS